MHPGRLMGCGAKRSARAYEAFLRDAGYPASDTLTPEALRAMREIVKRRGQRIAAERDQSSVRQKPSGDTKTTLHQAVQTGDIAGFESTLASGAEVNARDSRSWTALMHAVNKGYPLLVEQLLKAGADPDIRMLDGTTALFMAAVHGHTEIIAMLMAAGADITIRGSKGNTAVDMARKRYGDVDAARKRNVGPAVLALLQGITLTEQMRREQERQAEQLRLAAERRKQEETIEVCNWQLGQWTGCWIEVSGRSGCYVWNPNHPEREETVTWSGGCADGKAFGRGVLIWRYRRNNAWNNSREDVELRDGQRVE